MAWTTPKTDWVDSDYVNWSDYNRIIGNLKFLTDLVDSLYAKFDPDTITDTGDEITSYEHIWTAQEWNNIESALQGIIDSVKLTLNFGSGETFSTNGPFINSTELNRIESATLNIYERLMNKQKSRVYLPFTLGGVQF